MNREERFLELLSGLDDRLIERTMPADTATSVTGAVQTGESAEISRRDLRIYMTVRALGIAAAVVLIVGAAYLLIKNWDRIAARDPEPPAAVTTTTAITSGNTPAGVTETDYMLDASMPDNPFLLPTPSGYEGLEHYTSGYKFKFATFTSAMVDLVGSDEFTRWTDTYEQQKKYDMSGAGTATILEFVEHFGIPKEKLLEAVKSANSYENDEDYTLTAEDIEVIYSGDRNAIAQYFAAEYAIVSGDRAYSPMWLYEHTTEAYRKAGITPEMISEKLPMYEEAFVHSEKYRHMHDDAWNAFRAKMTGYALGNAEDRFARRTDLTMPEPFAPAETNFGARNFFAQWDRKFGNHYSVAEIDLIDLAAPADRDRYNKAAEITHETPYTLDDSANDYNHAHIMGLEGDALAEMIKKRNEEYFNISGLTGYRYSDEEIKLLTSGTRAEIIEHFRSDLAIIVGENVFSPMWLYYHTDEDYRAAGITGVRITEMIPYYKFAFRENTTGSRMTDEAWEAFYSKLSNYADTETNTVREQIEYAELPVPWKYYRNIQDNELDSLVYNFLLKNQEQIELFRRLYLWGCNAPGTQYLTRRYPDAEDPEQEYQYRMQDSSVLPFGTIEEFREWMHEYFSDGVCERYSLQMFDGWYQDGYYIPPYFTEENGKLYRYCMMGNPKCEMDYKTAKVIDMDIWRISDDGWRSIVDGTLWFACIGPENKLPALEYTAYYGTIEIKDGKPKLGFVPGVQLFEYHGETTGEIEGIWREKTNEDMKKKYEQLAGALIGQQRTELSLVDNSSGFGEAGLRIFEDAFYGEWEPETEPNEGNLMLTYKQDIFTFENFAYPSYLAETDELWVMAYINGGVGECCIVRRDDPDTLYRGWWEKAEDPDGNDTLITYNNRGIYRKKNDFILERGFRAGDTVSRFGLYKLMTQYNSEIWGRFCAEIGFKWPYALERAAIYTDSAGVEWTTECTASLPSRVMYYIGGNYTDNITLAVRFFNKKEYDLYIGNNYSSAYEPKEHYFALTLSTDENNIASVEYRPMDEMYREYDKMTFGSDDAGKYSVKLVCHDIKTVFGSLRFASAEIELRSGDELIASKSFSTPFVGLNEMSCLNNDDINIRVFEGGKDHALIAVMLPEENIDDRKFYITTLYWYNGTELNELDRFPELLSSDDLVFDENEILRYTDMNGETHAYAVSESGTWLMNAE